MNRISRTHCLWFLITIGMFVVGSHIGGIFREAVGSGGDGADGESAKSRFVSLTSSSSRSTPEEGAPAARKSRASRERMENSMARRDPIRSTAGGERARRDEPLSESRIQALVRQSTRSSNPVERRQAFDELLEAMQSGDFTREQAMMIRGAMARDGANGEQWRSFDYAWGANDPATALAHVDEISEEHRNEFLSNMIPGLASVDPDTAIQLFEGLEPAVQNRIRNRLFEGLIDHDVAVATDYIYGATDPARYDWRPMDILTREIVEDAGVDNALNWASDLPEGPLRGSAWSAAYAHWGQHQPEVAIQSIMDLEPSTDRNLAINGFTAAFAHQDGAIAVEWAAEITEPSLRQGALVRAATQFYRQDPQAATEWLSGSDLPRGVWPEITGVPLQSGEGYSTDG